MNNFQASSAAHRKDGQGFIKKSFITVTDDSIAEILTGLPILNGSDMKHLDFENAFLHSCLNRSVSVETSKFYFNETDRFFSVLKLEGLFMV